MEETAIKAPEYTDEQILDMLAKIFSIDVSDRGWKLS